MSRRIIISFLFVLLNANLSFTQIANFSLSSSQGCVPLKINCSDQSSNNAVKWEWNFGNGNQSRLQNPGMIYTQPGVYEVSLKVWDKDGFWDTATQIVQVFANPKANFQAADTILCTNEQLTLIPKVTLGSKGIKNYYWDFADGNTSQVKNPTHFYQAPGKFKISLLIVDSNGCSDAAEKLSYISVKPAPKVSFSSSDYGNCTFPHSVNFLSNTSGGTLPYSYLWNFEEHGSSVAQDPKVKFTKKGSYDIELIVKDSFGCTKKVVKKDLIRIADLSAFIKLTTDSIQCGTKNNFKLEAIPSFNLNNLVYKWNLGDGNTKEGRSISHQYKNNGNYSIILEVFNQDCQFRFTKANWLTVKEKPQTLFSVSDTILCEPSTIKFVAFSSKLKTYSWRVGDFHGANGVNAQINIADEGTYPVSLFIENEEGCANLIKGPNIHFETPKIKLVHNFDSTFCIPAKKAFEDLSNGKYDITNYQWNWSHGIKKEQNMRPTFNNTETVLQDTGIYRFNYSITNELGCAKDTSIYTKVGMKVKPYNFSIQPTIICPGETVQLIDSTLVEVNPITKTWYISGNPSSDGVNENTHTDPGWHDVTLTYNHNGCIDKLTKKNEVFVKEFAGRISIDSPECGDTNQVTPALDLLNVDHYTITYPDGSISKDKIKAFQPNQGLNIIKLAIQNDSLDCQYETEDTLWMPYIIEPTNVYQKVGTCAPLTIYANGKVKNLYKLYESKLFINNELVQTHTKPKIGYCKTTHQYNLSQAGSYEVKQVFYNFSGCPFYQKDTLFIIKGAKLAPVVEQQSYCSPLKFVLKDSFYTFNPSVKRYWLTGAQDTVWQLAKSVFTEIMSPVMINSKPHIIYVVDDGSDCVQRIPIEIQFGGESPLVRIRQIDDCHYPFYAAELLSEAKQSSIYWEYDGKITSANTFQGIGKFKSPGEHTIRLRYKNLFDCSFDATYKVWVDTPSTLNQFTVDRTEGTCPPLTVEFKNISKMLPGFNSFLWDFGDGSTSVLENPKKTYLSPGSYHVKLIINNSQGCTDTLTKPNLINIKGPLGKFKFPETEQCTPATVNFELFETNADSFYWDMGDGTLLNNVRNPIHEYTYAGSFIPVVVLKDKSGCQYTLQPIDTIFTFEKPLVDDQDLIVCHTDSTIIYPATSLQNTEIKSYQWLRNTEQVHADSSFKFLAEQKRDEVIQLIIENYGSCFDTSNIYIQVPKYKLSFLSNKPNYCKEDSIQVISAAHGTFPIHHYQWHWENQYNEGQQVSFRADKTGYFPIQLVITDSVGCKDSLIDPKPWVIGSRNLPENIPVLYTSVNSDIEVELKYLKAKNPDFWNYKIVDPSSNNLWGIINNVNDTLITKSNLNTLHNSYCFRVNHINACLKHSDSLLAKAHCTVNVEGKGMLNYSEINWTPYIGWPVKEYLIYRTNKLQPSNFIYLDRVPGTQLSFKDTSIECRNSYYYKILAIEQGGNEQQSWSDTCLVTPKWHKPPTTPRNWRVTVVDNSYTQLEWMPPQNSPSPIVWYNIRKQTKGKPIQNIPNTMGLSYKDIQTQVNDLNYAYWVQAVDSCNNISQWNKVSESILLKANLIQNKPMLHWNAYNYWKEGVSFYEIEYQDKNGTFIPIHQTQDTQFYHENFELNCIPIYNYRIKAYRNLMSDTNAQVVSYSNYARVVPKSFLFVPNAFTPNQNDLNEQFGPVGAHIIDYKLQIFNRWGEKLFDTQECMKGWNGVYMDNLCPEGVYIYQIYAQGIDGKVYNLKGNFTLLK